MSNIAKIEIVQGDAAPFHNDTTELYLNKVIITEKGTEKGLPIVD